MFLVCLHELIIGAPTDANSPHGSLLRTESNLVSVQIVEPHFVEQRLFDHFVKYKENIDIKG
jgi:hypothetical protein